MTQTAQWGLRPFDPLVLLDRIGRVVCISVGVLLGLGHAVTDTRPIDAGMIWAAGHSAQYYGPTWSLTALYIYPPPLAQLAGLLPWPVFIVPWMTLIFASLWYATRWLSGPIVLLGIAAWVLSGIEGPIVSPLLFSSVGNPQAIVAAAIVMGFRRPGAWAFVLLTKIGPGVGLLWFVVRGEWRSLGIALATTFAIAMISFVLGPSAWADFVGFAISNFATPSPVPVVPVPLLVRVPMAVVAIVWAARSDRPWVVLVAAGWSALALYQWSYLILWAAAIPLYVQGRGRKPGQ